VTQERSAGVWLVAGFSLLERRAELLQVTKGLLEMPLEKRKLLLELKELQLELKELQLELKELLLELKELQLELKELLLEMRREMRRERQVPLPRMGLMTAWPGRALLMLFLEILGGRGKREPLVKKKKW